MKWQRGCLILTAWLLINGTAIAEHVLDSEMHHLRMDGVREWTEFPEKAEADEWVVEFEAKQNRNESTLRLRHQDVKQSWQIDLNGMKLGQLSNDENDMVVYLPIPAGAMTDGQNSLRIHQVRKRIDDIRVGDIRLYDEPRDQILNRGSLLVKVHDASRSSGKYLPSRITIVDERGSLHTIGAASNLSMAVRPGVIYCNGQAKFGLPRGDFTITAGHGFEYGIASRKISITARDNESQELTLAIDREVATTGYISCDTHVHTFTHSRHGDSTIEERMLTIAAEGIELPIATDHNIHIDYEPIARAIGMRRFFTPVIGNEVSTKIGHFNVFPIRVGAAIPDYKLTDWKPIFESIYSTPNVQAVILNHGRDLHGGYRPFDPKHYNAVTGENLDGWTLQANAMELINSGATQTDPLRLYHDWFGLLNRGLKITPVGSSDSHDVGRHFVGQGRTYIKCRDDDPGNIDVAKAVDSFVQGRVMVSYGLLTEMSVNEKYGPGDLVSASNKVRVAINVKGPSWTQADRVELYANGRLIREAKIADGKQPGVKWKGEWTISKPAHDMFLVAVARGPGVSELYWPTAKAYQPTSPDWQSAVIGSTGAVWIDADGDAKPTSAFAYANRLIKEADNNFERLLTALRPYDQAVAAQAASLLQAQGIRLSESSHREQLSKAAQATRDGFDAYFRARRESQIARSQ